MVPPEPAVLSDCCEPRFTHAGVLIRVARYPDGKFLRWEADLIDEATETAVIGQSNIERDRDTRLARALGRARWSILWDYSNP